MFKFKWFKSKKKPMTASNIVVIKDNDEYSLQMKEYESMLQRQLEIQELNEKYHVTVNPSKKMVQYSKILTTIIIVFTFAVNIYFYFILAPHSSQWMVTDQIFGYVEDLLKIWNSGTILFLMAFLAKSLFETKFEEDSKIEKSKLGSTVDKVVDVVDNLVSPNDNSVG